MATAAMTRTGAAGPDEEQAVFVSRGRPSLARPARIDVRVPEHLKVEFDRPVQGRREPDVVREALEEYLAHH